MMSTRSLVKKALKEQIALTALELFKQSSYEKTTVEAISVATGMSTRTFFRYFRSKEEVLLEGTYAFKTRFLEEFVQSLNSADIWEALKNTLSLTAVKYCADPDVGEQVREIQKLVRETPVLFSRQLEIIESLVAEAANLYLSKSHQDQAFTYCTVSAIIRCGFSCLQSVQCSFPEHDAGDAFTLLMADLRPAILVKN